jgi:predicted nucleotidyltransferase
VQQLSSEQHALVQSLAARMAALEGVRAVVLGGSHARRQARPDSDIDLGLFYSEARPFAIAELRKLLEPLNDSPAAILAGFYEWGRWVNGGAWLSIGGQRVDVLYRSLEQLERVIDDCHAGRYEIDHAQQPPFGFFSATYLGEIAICVPLSDPYGVVAHLKQRVALYPPALQRAVVQDCLWSAELTLVAFAPKFAAREDIYGTVGCLTRVVNQLVLALFALNGAYLLNDKTALQELTQFQHCPAQFMPRVQRTLACPGSSQEELAASLAMVAQLLLETCELARELYRPRYALAVHTKR